ncbi:L-idonate 5-dehydrogenase [Mesorhizobium sp. M1E.F.Ca.ET.045.02.1.1]|uniref:L-idonate 5-dehydrogenase n=1 Tax=unclassified Mesorhizobium TaxID=325217 RepID=UPI000F75295B|nr:MULTISPECIES: L-idonate 5-dehydrogenase [unclassified Mesorhizobium]AZO25971.1 L-idonate 5-dehydrogenase [Mesorhizobium sp. M1E.F.Ca.ET.045.02.1.1]RUW20328.1 L-idonate 5-dehydrogenase [Mesorhizobium sp. M1E.F.Ca.ET.041.01.1.1]RWD81841.1 MAG: L-idonate 5-dehydrogenase [Mesorhizobium sp.]
MRVVVLRQPLDLHVEERATPSPGAGEVLVRIERGGICGSDLHYFRHGGFGTVRMKEPMILGHEIAGRVEALGAGVSGPAVGTAVAVNPANSCGACAFCRAGQPIHCLDMRFLGSAMRTPHVQGGFAEHLICRAENAVPLTKGSNPSAGAFAEPLAVTLHAVAQAPVYGSRVLIIGAGPIGTLLVLAARFAGAREIVVTDVQDKPLDYAAKAGADRTINVARHADGMNVYAAGKGYFDVIFEAAGQGATVASALHFIKPRGTLVTVGQGATTELSVSMIVTKEIALKGSFRFDTEFALAVDLIGSGRIDVAPLLSNTLPLAEARKAFELASDKSQSMKVQIAFD